MKKRCEKWTSWEVKLRKMHFSCQAQCQKDKKWSLCKSEVRVPFCWKWSFSGPFFISFSVSFLRKMTSKWNWKRVKNEQRIDEKGQPWIKRALNTKPSILSILGKWPHGNNWMCTTVFFVPRTYRMWVLATLMTCFSKRLCEFGVCLPNWCQMPALIKKHHASVDMPQAFSDCLGPLVLVMKHPLWSTSPSSAFSTINMQYGP